MAEKINNEITFVSIVRITPSILDRGQIWFEKNKTNIAHEAQKITSWWNANYMELVQEQALHMSELMRRLSDWNYQKVISVRNPGEFANRGGILDIFPINNKTAVRIEYEGNVITRIVKLENIKIDNPEKKLKNVISKPAHLPQTKELRQKEEHETLLASIQAGSYVVHVDHGIARYQGSERIQDAKYNNQTEDYLILEYAGNDKLRIPKNLHGRITPYVGFSEPTLTRLGGNLWEKTKRKVKEDLLRTAQELVSIYAKRELAQRPAYDIDETLSEVVTNTFAYEETPDQQAALDDVRRDLESKKPMDRIICGDVGFGKTEIALRAAALAVSAGYQVALVAPTTILAHQHMNTFLERFGGEKKSPINIEKLTRIEKTKKQKEILDALKNKKCDIVIGTHRLLQKDVEFANLGLLIIDEEQRFGVKQKEYFKKARAQLDILSLSATPIPRTLSFALSGLRDINVIMTPPKGRRPIKTFIQRFSKKIVKNTIEQELARDGQIFYLHNRIISLPRVLKNLRKLVPNARIDYMHAKLPERDLIQKIDDFRAHKIDILISTTIMENGLDLQNANTLIVDDATKLGLAQAHQIRGRIGRGERQAYAYFMYPARKLSEKPRLRLEALQNAQYLGAGYQLAMRDLEIRGAGNFLGKEQSGNIGKVGFNLYCQLLNEAIAEIRKAEQ